MTLPRISAFGRLGKRPGWADADADGYAGPGHRVAFDVDEKRGGRMADQVLVQVDGDFQIVVGLTEYAATFPTVCGDFAFYQFPSEQYWAKLFDATPSDFLLGLKAPEDTTVATWPKHARCGSRAGQPNDHFLDAAIFEQLFIRRLAPYEDRVGPRIFEFGTFNKSTFATPADFTARLDPFLKSLPAGYRYAVEIRNPDYLSPAYFEALAGRNMAHVFSAWTRMPALERLTLGLHIQRRRLDRERGILKVIGTISRAAPEAFDLQYLPLPGM
jgi:hypothetical protein